MNNRLASSDIEFIACEVKALFMKNKIKSFYKDSDDEEIKEILKYLASHRLQVFNHDFTSKYKIEDVEVEKDENNHMFYTVIAGKKMYLRKGYTSKFRAARYVKNIQLEQDIDSPHRYVDDSFGPEDESIIFDIGGAEGIFSLPYVEKAKHIFIFECSEEWVEALKITYKDYLDKVTIIQKFVSDFSDDTHITLDKVVEDYHLQKDAIFVKVDAEGEEIRILEGAQKLILENASLKLAICCYHKQNHEEEIRKIFNGCEITTSKGYMLYYYDFDFGKPYMRRGILRIKTV